MSIDDDLAATVALSGLPGMGPSRLRSMVAADAPSRTWERLAAGRPVVLDRPFPEIRAAEWSDALRADPAAILARHVVAGIGVVRPGDPGYPGRLADEHDAPAVLFSRGDPSAADAQHPAVAIVGTRRSTAYGEGVARALGAELAASGVTVVSGLALGIDGAAHVGATSTEVDGEGADPSGARRVAGPVAVVANGLDVVYPRRHRDLSARVARLGAVLSEVPIGARPERWRFPLRNRLIAALAPVLVVVESARGGGSMHTVREADDRGRTVMAVPGPVTSVVSVGPNQLLVDGCAPCRDADDVRIALGLSTMPSGARAPRRQSTLDEAAILDAFAWTPATVDQLAERSRLPLAQVSIALADLVAAGEVVARAGAFERSGTPR
ncbi:MAG TPA: DNA-processing protein DprA [Microthrixaceae bacterium]|nr:DNA-processing protein DprA [Microthrixaceae bacterium]